MTPYYDRDGITIYHGDAREILPSLPPVDLVLTDPPYGITANEWDRSIPPDELAGILRPFRTVVMTASQPFSSLAVYADVKRFRHEWIWVKDKGSNFANTVREPMKEHETVLVFSDGKWTYNAQRQERSASGSDRVRYKVASRTASENYRVFEDRGHVLRESDRCPSSVQRFGRETGLHPTQKPLDLMRYLMLTYSNPGYLILDPFMGSGTTMRAALDCGRRAIGVELEERYCEIAVKRLQQSVLPLEIPA